MSNNDFNILFDNGLPAKEIWQAKSYQVVQDQQEKKQYIRVFLDDTITCQKIKEFILNKNTPGVYFLENYSQCWFNMESCYLLITDIPKELLTETQSMPVKIALYDSEENFLISFE